MTMKVVILGSRGFIGRALYDAFSNWGGLEVEGYNSASFDLTAPECVFRISQALDNDTILIMTARSRGRSDPWASFLDDLAMAGNVARSLTTARPRKCIYFSTLSVYGDELTNLSIAEDTPLHPTSLYGVAKLAGEFIIRQVCSKEGIPLVVLRPCKVYGPGQAFLEYGPNLFIKSILSEGKVKLFGDGSELRDYLFIQDMVTIIQEFVFNNLGGIYNIGTGVSHSFQEIIASLRKILARDFEVVHQERDRLKIDQQIKPDALLGALPKLQFQPLDEGLRITCEYFSTQLSQGA
jgi:UDP-glucose 4-epimerase